MFGRVVNFKATGKLFGLLRIEGLVEAFRLVGVEVVHDQDDRLGLGVAL